MLRSLVYTLLLEEPEFRALSADDGSRLVTDAVERVRLDQERDPGLTVDAAVRGYVADLTPPDRYPGYFQRYADALRVSPER